MAISDFLHQLQQLGFTVEQMTENRLAFPYTVPVGRLAGHAVKLGFEVPGDFPLSPPSGPHVSPHLLTINTQGGAHPTAGVHPSPFGPEWQYWSRPFHPWNTTDHSVREYMAHIRLLFQTL